MDTDMTPRGQRYIPNFWAGAVFALICLGSAATYAADPIQKETPPASGSDELTGSITFGTKTLQSSRDSAKFGEFSNYNDKEGLVQGDVEIQYQRDDRYLELHSENLGQGNRTFEVEAGKFGDYEISFEYEQLPQQLNFNSRTPFSNPGSTVLTLLPGNATSGSSQNLPVQKDVELEIDDHATQKFGFRKLLGENTEITLSYNRSTKEGLRDSGGPVGRSGGTTRSVILPLPVDQNTNEASLTFARNGHQGQLQMEYFLSLFDNRIDSVVWQSPFDNTGDASFVATARISQLPDNGYHRLRLSGGWNFSDSTRASGTIEYGRMEQNETLLPFSINAGANALPRGDAQAEMHTIHILLNLASRPLENLNLGAKYRHYETINETERSLFLYTKNDSTRAGDSATLADSFALFNQPYDYRKDALELSLGYRVHPSTTVKLSYAGELMQRDLRAVRETFENTFKVGMRSSYFSFMNVNLGLAYSRKIGDKYDDFREFKEKHTDAFQAAGGNGSSFDSMPDMKRYDLANRNRLKSTVGLSFTPTDQTTLGISYNFVHDDFFASEFGITRNLDQNVTVDMDYSPGNNTTLYAFYTYDQLDWRLRSRERDGTDAAAFAPSRNWQADQRDTTQTVGLGITKRLFGNRVTLNADYTFSQSITDFNFIAATLASIINPLALPDLNTTHHTFDLKGTYRFKNDVEVGLNYIYENYATDDFATDGVDPNTALITRLTTLSGTVRDFEAHVAGVFLTYRFGGPASM